MRNAILSAGSWLKRTVSEGHGSRARVLVSPLSWRERVRHFLAALLVLGTAYQLYTFAVVPLIEPAAEMRPEPLAELDLPTGDIDPDLIRLFPEDAWERQKPMLLKTRWGKLLFRQYSTSADGRLELSPCTIVFYLPSGDESSAEPRPIILQAPDRAVLGFSGPLNLLRAEMGKLEGARLEGEVTITSPESRPGAGDAVHIVTRHVQILPKQIWTPHDVAFRYGPHYGSGRDLSITIATEPDAQPERPGDSWIKNLEMLEVAHVDKLVVQVPDKGLFGSADSATRSNPPRDRGVTDARSLAVPAVELVEVTCQGPFRFDFQQGIASLEDHVRVIRNPVEGPSDELTGHELRLYFELPGERPALDPAQSASSEPASPSGGAGSLALRSVEARGAPVSLRAASVDVVARGQLLAYDFASRQIVLQDEQRAFLACGTHQTEAPQVKYELPEDPHRLGKLWATGPGLYQGVVRQETSQTLRAQWSGVLQLQPQDGLHVMSVVEGADIRWDPTGQFVADELYLWLEEHDVSNERRAPSDPYRDGVRQANHEGPVGARPDRPSDASQQHATSLNSRSEIRPVKMLAKGNVRAGSPQFSGQTQQLEIWFDHFTPRLTPPVSADETTPGAVPGDAPSTERAPDPSPRDGQDKKLDVSGQQIRLRLLMTKPQPRVREATVMGDVRLVYTSGAGTEANLSVRGETLQLQTDSMERSSIDVTGAPARIDVQDVLLEGTQLHLSQRENRMWAEGPGRMRLPAQRAGREAPLAAAGLPATSDPVWITWQEGMDFDGQLVRFLQQVEVRGIHRSPELDHSHLRAAGDQLQALMNRYVDFAGTARSGELDVVELRFLGNVFVENQTYSLHDEIRSHDRLMTRDMVLDRRTGNFRALGPGWITSTRIDQKGNSGLGLRADRAVPPATAPPGSPRLVYLRVDYQNQITGNIQTRWVAFEHYVRTAYGPVASWDHRLDPDRRDGLGPNGVLITCNQLGIAETGEGPQRGLELVAQGNTLVEGNSFTAQAARLAYTQVKDQLVIEGDGRGFAQLRQQRRIGEPPTEFVARKIMYWVHTGQVEVFDAKQLDYTHLDTPDAPSARIR